jgi:hypothetical protein
MGHRSTEEESSKVLQIFVCVTPLENFNLMSYIKLQLVITK